MQLFVLGHFVFFVLLKRVTRWKCSLKKLIRPCEQWDRFILYKLLQCYPIQGDTSLYMTADLAEIANEGGHLVLWLWAVKYTLPSNRLTRG